MSESVLLTTVFKPFGIDDLYGRQENIPELLMAQVTRAQGLFTPRMWHANAGLHLIAANCEAPTTILEWPSLDEFRAEIRNNDYDYIGISFIPCTYEKMKRMVELVRSDSPRSEVIVGGHGTIVPDISRLVDADHVCEGEGIRYVRNLLGKQPEFDFEHPTIVSHINEFLGIPIPVQNVGQICTGLGCQNGCDFCVTSAYFDCAYLPFLSSGEEVGKLILEQCTAEKMTDFWVIDENFLQSHSRAVELHDFLTSRVTQLPFYNLDMVWSSAENVARFDPKLLAEIGITSIWIGHESRFADYNKNRGSDIRRLIEELDRYGITVLLSSILFFDFHDEEKLKTDVDDAIGLGQAYSQFLPLMAWPETRLHRKMEEEGRLIESIPWEDSHGLSSSVHEHPHFSRAEQHKLVEQAYRDEYLRNGPSILRIFRTRLNGYDTFARSTSPILSAKASGLRKRLESHVVWVVALEELVDDCHEDLVKDTLDRIERVLGKDVLERQKRSSKYLAEMVRRGIDDRSGELVTRNQPELRRSTYHRPGLDLDR